MKHYLYRHTRIDKGDPFYIGVGTKKDRQFTLHTAEYDRAYKRHKENNIWCKIVDKTQYEVEILIESDDYYFIKQKEIEFIKLYGRIDLDTGILSNMTDGGDGIVNLSEETKRRMSKRMLDQWKDESFRKSMSGENSHSYGIKLSEEVKGVLREGKLGIKNPMYGKVGDLNPMYGVRGKAHPHFGKPRTEYTKKLIGEANSGGNHGMARKVLDTSTNMIYDSAKEAASTLKMNYSTLTKYLTGSRKNKTTLIYYIEQYE